MIRITKPPSPPAILRTRGTSARKKLCATYDADEAAYRAGTKYFESAAFDKEIYGAAAVKTALRQAQHDKCAFCESKVSHISYGDVEHFRPKAGVKQRERDRLERPGYYWLAFEWDNLFFCCQLCNQRFKRNLFPLRDPARRARSHRDRIEDEDPLLIDPSRLDPEQHITWRDEYPKATSASPYARATIDLLGLDRDELVVLRRSYLLSLRQLKEVRDHFRELQREGKLSRPGQAQLTRLEEHIETLTRPDSPYAAMARAFFAEA